MRCLNRIEWLYYHSQVGFNSCSGPFDPDKDLGSCPLCCYSLTPAEVEAKCYIIYLNS